MQSEDKNLKRKRKNTVFQRLPLGILYYPARFIIRLMCKHKFNLVESGERVHGPALILSNHNSNDDYKFVAAAVRPARVSFLATYHFFTFKKFSFWLKIIGAIPKLQFTTDLEALRKIQYVIQRKKGCVFIAPEGTIYGSAHLGYISPSIAKMIRFLKVPVYACKIQGAGLGNAKWSAHSHKGKISIDTRRILTAEEAASLDRDTVMRRITDALSYSDFEFQSRENFLIEGSDKAEGFETMFYKCPSCSSEFKIRSKGNDVFCTCCGVRATIQPDFRFLWEGEKQYFENYSRWYDWQYEQVKAEVANPDFKMEDEVDYGIDEPGIDNYIKVGHGILTFSHKGWDYKGTYRNEEIEEHDDPRSVFLATLKVGQHFELPNRNGHNRVYYPKDGLTSMKWHIASRAMSELLGS
ncbi:MAG: lysophospholipid acyltransferase family protein [Sphaerochaeta sp.]